MTCLMKWSVVESKVLIVGAGMFDRTIGDSRDNPKSLVLKLGLLQ